MRGRRQIFYRAVGTGPEYSGTTVEKGATALLKSEKRAKCDEPVSTYRSCLSGAGRLGRRRPPRKTTTYIHAESYQGNR